MTDDAPSPPERDTWPRSEVFHERIRLKEEFAAPALSGDVDAATRKAAKERAATDKSEDRGAILAMVSALTGLSLAAGAALELPVVTALLGIIVSTAGLAVGRLATHLALEGLGRSVFPGLDRQSRVDADSVATLDADILTVVDRLSRQRTQLEALGCKSRDLA